MGHDVVAVEVVKSVFGCSGAAEFQGSSSNEAKAGGEVRFVGVENVGGELLSDKVVPGNIGIKAFDDVVAKSPGVRTFLVVLTTVGVGEVNGV